MKCFANSRHTFRVYTNSDYKSEKRRGEKLVGRDSREGSVGMEGEGG